MSKQLTLAEMFAANPNQVFDLNPDDPNELLIRPERNSRGFTPEIGDKVLSGLIERITSIGQNVPCLATLTDDGVADLYAGFRRARSIQTHNATEGAEPMLLRVLITPTQLTDFEVYERSLSENVDRENMSIMQRVNALLCLTEPPNNLSLANAGKKLNMSKALASVYVRFSQFPANAKRALDSGKLTYGAAEKLVALLPKREVLEAEGGDEALDKAQQKIASYVDAQLAKGKGPVKRSDADKATRKMAGADGKTVANKTQRRTAVVIRELDDQIEVTKAIMGKAAEVTVGLLAAFKKFVNGGSMKALLKSLEG